MDRNFRSLLAVCALVLGAAAPAPANAATNDVNVIACQNSLHVADFTSCVQRFVSRNGSTGLVVAANPTSALSSLVRVTGTFTWSCGGKGTCTYFAPDATYKPVMMDGTPITSDADLATVDQNLFAALRQDSNLTTPIVVPDQYGTSVANNDTFAVDTNTAINVVLGNRGLIPSYVPLGQVVVVKFKDGSTARFIRTNSMAPLLWVYVPGSARNGSGDPVTPTGTILSNPVNSGAGGGSINPTVSGTNPWILRFNGGNQCTGTGTLDDGNGNVTTWIFYLPCN